MALIKNLVREPQNLCEEKHGAVDETGEENKAKPIVRSALDVQRLKLEKLMKNPDKPVIIPEHKKEKDFMQSVPTFVRNVMGSSAGAGSGEFHVYRHLRRKEYARQKMIQSRSHHELLDEEYQQKIDENRRKAEEKTAKKRAKRLKKKNRVKRTKLNTSANNTKDDNMKESDSDTEEVSATESEVINEVFDVDKTHTPEKAVFNTMTS